LGLWGYGLRGYGFMGLWFEGLWFEDYIMMYSVEGFVVEGV
jgi:hypothetical protein